MKVGIINPPYSNLYYRFFHISTFHYPYEAIFLATLLKERGIEVNLLDLTTEASFDVEKAVTMTLYYSPDVVVINTYLGTFHLDTHFIKLLKKRNPNLKIVLNGDYPRYYPFSTLYNLKEVDLILLTPLLYQPEILESIFIKKQKLNLSKIEGIAFRRVDGGIEVNSNFENYSKKIPFSPNISMIGDIYSRFLDYKKYDYEGSETPVVGLPLGLENLYLTDDYLFSQIREVEKCFFSVKEIILENGLLPIDKSYWEKFPEYHYFFRGRIPLDFPLDLLPVLREKRFLKLDLWIDEESLKDKNMLTLLEETKKLGLELFIHLELNPIKISKKMLREIYYFFNQYPLVNLVLTPLVLYPYSDTWNEGKAFGTLRELEEDNFRFATLFKDKADYELVKNFIAFYRKRKKSFSFQKWWNRFWYR